jgi:hypothetical protein
VLLGVMAQCVAFRKKSSTCFLKWFCGFAFPSAMHERSTFFSPWLAPVPSGCFYNIYFLEQF